MLCRFEVHPLAILYIKPYVKPTNTASTVAKPIRLQISSYGVNDYIIIIQIFG